MSIISIRSRLPGHGNGLLVSQGFHNVQSRGADSAADHCLIFSFQRLIWLCISQMPSSLSAVPRSSCARSGLAGHPVGENSGICRSSANPD